MGNSALDLPDDLILTARQLPGGAQWLRSWPALLEGYLGRWELTLDLPAGGTPWAGRCAVVVPVRRAGGTPAALKIGIPHDEARAEPDALELWGGNGAVRLLAADRSDSVLLLERLEGDESLLSVPLDQTGAVWGKLMLTLSIRPGSDPLWAAVPLLAAEAETWTDTLPADWEAAGEPFPRWLLEHALEVCQVRGAVGRRWARDVLVHSDLHYGNILPRPEDAPGGREWVAIDPKPLVGDAEYALAPMLWNRLGDLSPNDPAAHLRRRCSSLAAAAGLDPVLARDWSVLREVRNALGYLNSGAIRDARRSLWVASSLLGRTLPDLPPAHCLTG